MVKPIAQRQEQRYSEDLNLGLPVDDPSPNGEKTESVEKKPTGDIPNQELDVWIDLSRELKRYSLG